MKTISNTLKGPRALIAIALIAVAAAATALPFSTTDASGADCARDTNPQGCAPENLTAEVNYGHVILNWERPPQNDQGCTTIASNYVYRRSPSQGETRLELYATIDADVTTYTDHNVDFSQTYVYRVAAAQRNCARSVRSNFVRVETPDEVPVPQGVTATSEEAADNADDNIVITWDAVDEDGLENYVISSRPADGDQWTTLGEVEADTLTYTDATAPLNEPYTYGVQADFGGILVGYRGVSPAVARQEYRPTPVWHVFATVTNVEGVSSIPTVRWDLEHQNDIPEQFIIFRCDSAGADCEEAHRAAANIIAWDDTGLAPIEEDYTYGVVALHEGNQSSALVVSSPVRRTAQSPSPVADLRLDVTFGDAHTEQVVVWAKPPETVPGGTPATHLNVVASTNRNALSGPDAISFDTWRGAVEIDPTSEAYNPETGYYSFTVRTNIPTAAGRIYYVSVIPTRQIAVATNTRQNDGNQIIGFARH